LTFTYREIQDGERPQNYQPSDRHNSATNSSILLKLGMWVQSGSAELVQWLKSRTVTVEVRLKFLMIKSL